MSPSELDAREAAQAGPVVVTDCPNKAANSHFEEKLSAPVGSMNKVLTMLGGLSERMNRVYQKEQIVKGQKGSPKLIFGSALGVGAGMSLQDLKRTPPPKKSPNVSPATYFGARRHNQVNVGE